MAYYSVIGQRLPRVDAKEKVNGEAKYTVDVSLPLMLHGKVLRSPYPHPKILHIETKKAKRLPGVKAVVTADDTLKNRYGFPTSDEETLAIEKARFIGDEVAAAAAIDEDITEEALDLIQVDYQELPAVFDFLFNLPL